MRPDREGSHGTDMGPARVESDTQPSIVFIGPLPPFRGGIAQHTMMLSRALFRRSNLLVISFTRQYSGWLFPGERVQDPDAERLTEPYCRYLLDSLNPLTWREAVRAVIRHRPRVAIIPWWTIYWAPCFVFLRRRLRAAGIPVIFLCHNIVDHEAAWWKRAITGTVLRGGTGFIVQSTAEEERLQTLVAGAHVAVYSHPVYTQFPPPSSRLPRRAALELLFFGFVRPYKGLDILLRAIARLDDHDLMVTVVGEFWEKPERMRALIRELGIADRVEIIARYVSEGEIANLFARADALVMPYRSATGSGVLTLAYHYGKPVIASNVPGLADVVLEGKTGFLVEPESVASLAAAIGTLTAKRAAAMAPLIHQFANRFTWDGLAEAILSQIDNSKNSLARTKNA